MKIGLLTIHRVTNYGAILQAFASKEILGQYGDVKTIDYHKEHLSHNTDLVRFKFSIHGVKMFVHDILNLKYRSKLLKKFKSFNDQYMNLTNGMDKNALVSGSADYFDVYVCGSDQIWNPGVVSANNSLDPIFFLSFANGKKVSFASSIGHHNFKEKEKPIVRQLLSNFHMVSTREKDGQKKLEEIIPDKKIHHVLDPSLLLNKRQWTTKFDLPIDVDNEDYILVYSVPRTQLIKSAISYFSKKLGMKVYAIDRMFFPITKVDNHIRSAGPKDFLELFANSSFVITDSFHGTCFSLNFEKPFACISALERANRQISLLSSLDIEERLMFKESDFENLETTLDYTIVSKKLANLRKNSLDFIESAMRKEQ
jgi:hypothetical protein